MTCLTCEHFNLQQYKEHAKVGLGRCIRMPVGSFYAIEHPICERFKAAKDEKERREWAEKHFKPEGVNSK